MPGGLLRENEAQVKADEIKYEKAEAVQKEIEKKNFLYNPVHGTMEANDIE